MGSEVIGPFIMLLGFLIYNDKNKISEKKRAFGSGILSADCLLSSHVLWLDYFHLPP